MRVLQEGEFERVGDDVTRSVDIRIVAATNRDLEAEIVAGRFREDLFYRLSVFPVEVPPLRERGDDVVQLAQHFLEQTLKDFGREPLSLTQSQAKALRAYPWPGNVRELKNVMERAVILSPGSQLCLEIGASPGTDTVPGTVPETHGDDILTEQEIREFTRANIVRALEVSNWRVSGKDGAAERLGLRPTTLTDRMKSYEIVRPARR